VKCISESDKCTSEAEHTAREYIPAQSDLISAITAAVPAVKSISLNSNTENTNVILGSRTVTIYGEDTITDTIHVLDSADDFKETGEGVTFRISPQSFYQVNPVQTEKLYSTALEYAGLTGNETVWDLYCGIGTISLFLAHHAKKVCGVEIVSQAIDDARRNAVENGITNAEFFLGKAEEVLPKFYEEHTDISIQTRNDMIHPDVIVVDPPRKGCDIICLDTMLKMKPDRIVYVSCDSATLARDLKILTDGGYELKRVRACDQFPMTVHIETVVLLSRVSNESRMDIASRHKST
jgi:23S rRNA (uracil1939-C5)-methyltransferase